MVSNDTPWDLGLTVHYAAVIAFAFAVAFCGIVVLRRFWKFERGVDAGDGIRKYQDIPVLRVGGLPIYAAFVVSFFFAVLSPGDQSESLVSYAFLILGSAIFLLGILDDLFHLPAQLKFFAQIVVAVAAYGSGMRIDIISNPVDSGSLELGGFGLVLTVLWFVSVPNLINLIDGMDGLAGGVSLFLAITLAAIGMMTGNAALATMSVGVAGGIAAFLVFNLPPARIYMGDGGAYLLGFFIAGASLLTSHKASIFGPLLVVIIALGFPILDTSLAVLRRGLSGLPVMAPDARHLHHRLLTLGFSKRNILMVLYGIFAGLCLLGLSVFVTKGNSLPIAGMIVVVSILSALRFLGLPHNLREARKTFGEIVSSRKDVRYAYSMAQVLEHDIDRIDGECDYWNELRLCLGKLGIRPAEFDESGNLTCGPEGCLVILPVSDVEVWQLRCSATKSSRSQWRRVVRCFLPALLNGKARWGHFPDDLGLGPWDAAEGLEHAEQRLNDNAGAVAANLINRSTDFSKL
ncbi:MAG: undecaprenyl/decaprenyl-phosphate alpha-N-acetylglucosaminyl 1-phosphate transferase [Verrucomicrobiales bacterium]|nr:undecaprenyl/decaprenyl-phosphate alpha-N-acetylglucosaminyl 1-phosphate transferase [Verrucomicrobiales bacterium]